MKKTKIPIVASLLLALALLSCGRGAAKSAGSPEGPGSPGQAVAVAPATSQALSVKLSYAEGKVEAFLATAGGPAGTAPTTRTLGPGDSLSAGESIRTGPASSCDLDIEGLGRIHLQANTLLKIELSGIVAESAAFRASIGVGRVLAVSRKLAGKESFVLSTKNAICGVRGTAFSLEASGDTSLLVVAEGRVTLLPNGPALARLESAALTNGAARTLLRAAVAVAPVAGPGQALRIGPKEAASADAALAGLVGVLPPPAAAEALPPEAFIPAEDLSPGGTPPSLPDLSRALPSAVGADAAARLIIEALTGFAGKFRGEAGSQAGPPGLPPKMAALLKTAPVFPGHHVEALTNVAGTGIIVASCGEEGLAGLRGDGTVAWRLSFLGGGKPVLSKGKLYVAGPGGFIVVNAADGVVIASAGPLSALTQLASYPSGIVAASETGLSLYYDGSAEAWKPYPIEGGALDALPLGVKDGANSILVLRGRGGLAILKAVEAKPLLGGSLPDPEDGSLTREAPGPVWAYATPYGAHVALAGPPAVEAGEGRVALYDLGSLAELWSRPLPFRPEADPYVGADRVLVWGEGRLAAFTMKGEAVASLEGLSAPPLLARNVLYYGLADGSFVRANAQSLKTEARVQLPALLSGRPLPVDKDLRLPLADGNVLFLAPDLMGR
jgi:hypothetical protein